MVCYGSALVDIEREVSVSDEDTSVFHFLILKDYLMHLEIVLSENISYANNSIS